MCPTGDKHKYGSYERYVKVCVLWEIRTSMCHTGDRNKNKSAISVRSV